MTLIAWVICRSVLFMLFLCAFARLKQSIADLVPVREVQNDSTSCHCHSLQSRRQYSSTDRHRSVVDSLARQHETDLLRFARSRTSAILCPRRLILKWAGDAKVKRKRCQIGVPVTNDKSTLWTYDISGTMIFNQVDVRMNRTGYRSHIPAK